MIRNTLKFIIAAAVMCGVAFGTMFLASSRSLPFLPKEAPQYSAAELSEESGEEISDDSSQPEEELSGDESSSAEPVSEIETVKFVSACDTVSPGTFEPLDRRYSQAEEKIVRVSLPFASSLGEDGVTAVRMGFVFFADGRIFDSSFNDITSLAQGYEFLGVRDSAGLPVFKKGDAYYNYDKANGFVDSVYDPILDVTGFAFDVPVYLCEKQMPIDRVYSKKNKAYGFFGEDGVYYAYLHCKEAFAFYPFIENGVERGIGCVVKRTDGEDKLVFYSTRYRHLNDSTDNTLSTEFYPPETRGIESIGYFYFCEGYIRVRNKTSSGWEERLMDTGCNLARTLSGYNIKGYSDGRILYERNGLYGFTTNSLNWITNPDLVSAYPFTEGLASVTRQSGSGMIDTDGRYVVPAVFTKVTPCSGGVFAAFSPETGWQFFAKISANPAPQDTEASLPEQKAELSGVENSAEGT